MSQILLFLTAFSRLRQTCLVSFMVSLTGRNREVFHLCGAGARQCMRWPWNFLTPHVVRALLLRSSRELEKEILSPVHESWTRVTSRLERAFTTGELVNTISTSPLERSINCIDRSASNSIIIILCLVRARCQPLLRGSWLTRSVHCQATDRAASTKNESKFTTLS